MQKKKQRNHNWPMNLILGGVLLTAFAVLLAYGLQSDGRDPVNSPQPLVLEPAAARLPSVAAVEAESSVESPVNTETEAPEAAALAMLQSSRSEPVESVVASEVGDLDLKEEEPSFLDAEEAFQAADYTLAARRFTRYSEAHPGNPWGHYMLGLSQWRDGRLDAAETALARSLELNPDFAKARRNLARVLMSGARHEAALTVLQAAGEVDLALAEHQRLLGRALHNLDRPDEALTAYAAALAVDPTDAWALNNLGLILVEGERFEDALSAFALAADLDPNNAIFLNNLGVVLERRGFGGQASEAYRQALELDGEHDRARASLARVEALEPAVEAALDLNTLVAMTAGELAAGRFPWKLETAAEETLISQLP
jgi:tetratricopeptide (TPR) repeat protein